jgi:hypothetical protein
MVYLADRSAVDISTQQRKEITKGGKDHTYVPPSSSVSSPGRGVFFLQKGRDAFPAR